MVIVVVVAIVCDDKYDDADADDDGVADVTFSASGAKASMCPLAGLFSTIWVSA